MDPEPLVADVEVLPQELRKISKKLGIRVGHRNRMTALLALGPIEHASTRVRVLALSRASSPLFLIRGAPAMPIGLVRGASLEAPFATSIGQRATLRIRQRDALHPATYRRTRDPQTARDLFHRAPFGSEAPGFFLLFRFHNRQRSDRAGRIAPGRD